MKAQDFMNVVRSKRGSGEMKRIRNLVENGLEGDWKQISSVLWNEVGPRAQSRWYVYANGLKKYYARRGRNYDSVRNGDYRVYKFLGDNVGETIETMNHNLERAQNFGIVNLKAADVAAADPQVAMGILGAAGEYLQNLGRYMTKISKKAKQLEEKNG